MFESTLVASRRQPASRQRLLALPVAVLVHLVALSGFVLAQLVTTSPVPEPPLFVSLNQEFLPPTPPPPPPPERGTDTPSEPSTPPPADTQPQEVPPTSVSPLDPETLLNPTSSITGEPGGVPGGVSGGQTSGIPGGVVSPESVGPGPTTPDDVPIRPGDGVLAPVLVHRVDPRYPEIAVKTRTQGPVILEAVIDRQGWVVEAKVMRDIGMGCGESALQAVRQWRYRPATLNGRAVSVYLTVTVRFELN